jgi:hypothetical protein
MKKRIYLSLLLLPAVLILSGCGKKTEVKLTVPAAQNNTATKNVAVEKKASETIKITKSAKEMISGGQSLDCTFSFTDAKQGVTQTGKFYVDGAKKRFRSETEIVTGPTSSKIKSYMITDGDYGYSWSSMSEKTGFKINLNESQPANNATGNAQNTEDLDQKIDFECRDWPVDNAMFTLPAGVTFTDFSEMMKALGTPAKTIK